MPLPHLKPQEGKAEILKKDERERLMKFADEWIERIRSEMSDIRGDGTTKGQQGHAPAQQGAKEADSKEADTNAAEE